MNRIIKSFDTKLDFVLAILFILIVPLLVSGPFLHDLILSALGLTFLIMTIRNNNLFIYYNKKFTILFILFYLIILTSSLLSQNILLSLESSLFYFRYYFFSIFVFYFISKYSFIKNIFLTISLLTFVFLSIDAVFQYFNKYSLFFSIPIYDTYRASSLFLDELKLGNYIVRLMPIIFALLIINRKLKKIEFVLLAIFSFAILVSGERTALGLLLIFIFFHLAINLNFKTIFIYILSFLVVFFSLFFTENNIKERMFSYSYDQIFEEKSKYSSINIFSEQHTGHYIAAIEMFFDKPILGIGPKIFREECKKLKYQKNEYACTTHPHNTYIQLLAETGVIGFSIVLLIFLLSLTMIIKLIFNKDKSLNDLAFYYLILSIFINLWPIAPSFNFFNNWINIIFYLPVGFILYFNDKYLSNKKIKEIN